MNLEFAEQVRKKGEQAGLDIGLRIQPLIERRPDPSGDLLGGHELANALNRRFACRRC